jgi:hypothetical protein
MTSGGVFICVRDSGVLSAWFESKLLLLTASYPHVYLVDGEDRVPGKVQRINIERGIGIAPIE